MSINLMHNLYISNHIAFHVYILYHLLYKSTIVYDSNYFYNISDFILYISHK